MLLRACEVEALCGRERSGSPQPKSRALRGILVMLIVAVDTSGRQGSIALCRGDGEGFEVLQLCSLEGGTYSALLMPRLAEALQQNNLDKTKVDGFVVVSGP